jgi:fibro-slime domain-containing protein
MTLKVLQALVLAITIFEATCSLTLTGTIRDFTSATHPDFEYTIADDRNIVTDTIGDDRKPVYKSTTNTITTHGKTLFDQWYRDTPGVNLEMPYSITLEDDDGDGIYTYINDNFFPIDNMLLGNEGNNHNFHFTYEIHTEFTYRLQQVFNFFGDDDVYVYINDKLVINLGGIHAKEYESVNLDTLGLTPGEVYKLDFFFAERHTTNSDFELQTSVKLRQPNIPQPATCCKTPQYID